MFGTFVVSVIFTLRFYILNRILHFLIIKVHTHEKVLLI